MESLVQFFDVVDDLIIATALRLQRSLARKPKERRKALRTPDIIRKPTFASERKQIFAERGA